MSKCDSCLYEKEQQDKCLLPDGIGGLITSCIAYERYCGGNCDDCPRNCEYNEGKCIVNEIA